MFKEATEFSLHLKNLERDLRSMQKDVEAKFLNLRHMLVSPLPRSFEEGRDGAVPCTEEPKMIGHGVGVDILQQSAIDLKTRLEEEVIHPLRAWHEAYRKICERMVKLESMRLELDSRRRTVDSLTDREERLRRTTPAPQHKDKHEQELEKLSQLRQHKEEKMNRTSDAYREMEHMVYNSLILVIKDTGVLREYTSRVMKIFQDCYQTGFSAFSTMTPLLDYHTSPDNFLSLMPMMDDGRMLMGAPSDRSRQASELHGIRKDGMGMYAPASDDGGDARQYGNDQQIQPQMSGLGGYGEMQQPVNPYHGVYQPNPHGNRYVASPSAAAWQY
ncbi:hypothetical protein PLESTB_000593500 [Pleodorina starrii]|uniref:BAR domain-containing protein n=1 Tax=Pleodorina starrii TaxID=330485 RepID=A0A9W6BI24_9CHLO|nr:hypothetical protein PLESTB_000593500 [Pleodorina starrii]GLC75823.1 hypothetical protein PLESTF_001691500 [Pleodorina starrii]